MALAQDLGSAHHEKSTFTHPTVDRKLPHALSGRIAFEVFGG